MWGGEETRSSRRRSSRSRSSRSTSSYFSTAIDDSGPPVIHKRTLSEKALQLIDLCITKYPLTYRNMDSGGLYTGAGGLAFAMFHLSRCGSLREEMEVLQANSVQFADIAVQYCKKRTDDEGAVSFLYGKGGIYAVCAAIYKTNGKDSKAADCLEKFAHGHWLCKDLNYSMTGGDDLANGRAGYIAGTLWLGRYFTSNEIRLYTLYELLRVMVEAGKQSLERTSTKTRYSQILTTVNGPSPLFYVNMGSAYLGLLMGMTGVLRVLLLCPFFLDEQKRLEKEVKQTVDFILSLQKDDGTYPDKLEDVDAKKMSYEDYAQWKSGTGGICSLMAAAYLRWKDEKYLDSCCKSCEFAWNRGLYKGKFGLGNGTAGTCYLFLMMYRITMEEKYIQQALLFAEFLISDKHLATVINNSKTLKDFSLMEGLAGISVLLTDLLNPTEADFPFLPVFSPTTRVQ